jgi:hypothetical protein
MGPVTFRLALILLLAGIFALLTAVFRLPGHAHRRLRFALEGLLVVLGTAVVLLAPARVPFTHTLTSWLDILRHEHGLSLFEAIPISAVAALAGTLLSWRSVLGFLVAPIAGTLVFISGAGLFVPARPGAPPVFATMLFYAPFFLLPPAYLVTWVVGLPAHLFLRRLSRPRPAYLVILFVAVGGIIAILLGTWAYILPLALAGMATVMALAAVLTSPAARPAGATPGP